MQHTNAIDGRNNHNRDQIKVTQLSPTLLKCQNKIYKIDPEHVNDFTIQALWKVNPQKDAMYIMYHDKAYTTRDVIANNLPVMNEVWCDLQE